MQTPTTRRPLLALAAAFAISGCTKKSETPAAEPDPAPAAPAVTVAETPRSNAAAPLDGRWLVIALSSPVPTDGAETIAALKAAGLGLEPLLVQSSQLKNLMPCYQVVVAAHFGTRREAVELSRRLRAKGLKGYPKNAGDYVGSNPRVEAYCVRRSEDKLSNCPGEAHFVTHEEDMTYLRLDLDSVLEARLLETAPKQEMLSLAVWRASLRAKKVGPYATGDAFTVVESEGQPTTCRIESFVTLTRGQPHFSFGRTNGAYDDDSPAEPGCGSPELFAQLTCDDDFDMPWLAFAAPRKVDLADEVSLDEQEEDTAVRLLAADPSHGRFARQAAQEAELRQAPLEKEVAVAAYGIGKKKYAVVTVTWTTGEGNNRCGNEDLNLAVRGVAAVGGEARILSPYVQTSEDEVRGMVELGNGGEPEMLMRTWNGSRQIETPGGDPLCADDVAYCDCGC